MILYIVKKHYRAQLLYKMQCPFFLFILPLVACPLWGQAVQKKMLTPQDYHLWGEVSTEAISADENWAAYQMEYGSGQDTLFVRNILKNTTYYFAGGGNGTFTSNGLYICQIGEELNILNLKTAKKEIITGVLQYSYSETLGDLIYLKREASNKNALQVRALSGKIIANISGVTGYLLSPDGKHLLYTTSLENKNAAALIYLKKPNDVKWIQKECDEKLVGLTWQKKGRAFAFIKQHDDLKRNEILYYILDTQQLFQLNSLSSLSFPQNYYITYDPYRKIMISDDLQKVFLAVHSSTSVISEHSESKVEIWNANDKWIYPDEKSHGKFDKKSKIALWQPKAEQVNVITSNELPSIMLSGDMHYAILSNPKEYEPQFEIEGPRDFYILNLKTFEKKIFLKKQPFDTESLNPSPGGKYFAYFKENNWWIYDLAKDTHKNITAATAGKFIGKKQELVPQSVYGNPGWSLHDKEIILYDQYDLWAITPDGSKSKRLTKGRERQISFRIIDPSAKYSKLVYDGPALDVIKTDQTLILRAKGYDGKTGCFKWNKSSGEKPVVYNDSYIDQIKFGNNKQSIIFREQKFDLSPQLLSMKDYAPAVCFFKSNPQQKKYFWGKSELIEFQNSKGYNLKGVLLYPANYDPKKKYPMIVNIYEGKADELHLYQNPTYANEGGFNATLMTLEGYFVLLPDIRLEFQNPGIAAADCVIAATRKVIEKDIVNPEKMGLMGHSFGGYESAFIITQTSLFATAVASGAITDLVSFYHTVGRSGNPDMWRFEGEQWNMGGSPHNIPSSYQANSPLTHAVQVQKPVLLWTGKNDMQVDTHQSLEFYLALRRLKKESIMLIYPNEGHVITDAANQKDITIRMIEWFNYFLKDDHSYQWINKAL